jgi:hypothetical protein
MQESLYTLRFANASIYTFQDFGKRIKESTVGLCHLVASQHGVLNFFARESCSATNSVVDSTLKRVGIEHQSRYGYNSWSIRRKSESRCRMQFLSGFHKIHFTTGIERFTRLRVHLGNRSNISFLSCKWAIFPVVIFKFSYILHSEVSIWRKHQHRIPVRIAPDWSPVQKQRSCFSHFQLLFL